LLSEPAKAIIAGSAEDLPLRRGDDRRARRLCSAATGAAWCWLVVATLPADRVKAAGDLAPQGDAAAWLVAAFAAIRSAKRTQVERTIDNC